MVKRRAGQSHRAVAITPLPMRGNAGHGDTITIKRSDFESLLAANERLTAIADQKEGQLKVFDRIWTVNNTVLKWEMDLRDTCAAVDVLVSTLFAENEKIDLLIRTLPVNGRKLDEQYKVFVALCDELEKGGYPATDAARDTRERGGKMALPRLDALARFETSVAQSDGEGVQKALSDLIDLGIERYPTLAQEAMKWRAELTAKEQAEQQASQAQVEQVKAAHAAKSVSHANAARKELKRRVRDALKAHLPLVPNAYTKNNEPIPMIVARHFQAYYQNNPDMREEVAYVTDYLIGKSDNLSKLWNSND